MMNWKRERRERGQGYKAKDILSLPGLLTTHLPFAFSSFSRAPTMSFIFQMDVNDELNCHRVPATSSPSPPTTDTTTERIMVDYSPKPISIKSQSPSPERGIKTWLASHGSSYLPHDQPHSRSRGCSPRRARNSSSFALHSSYSSDSDFSDSEGELEEEDAIFLQPRRHLSRQGSGRTSPVSKPAPSRPGFLQNKPSTHHHLHLTAQRPALPVVDLSAASGHVELDLEFPPPVDKSHWSDDESDVGYPDEENSEDLEDEETEDADGFWALPPDEFDVPALVDDEEGNPASTSTRSIPIPSGPPRMGLMSRRMRPGFDLESPPTRRKSTDGQSFWTPWMDQYLADVAAVAQAAR